MKSRKIGVQKNHKEDYYGPFRKHRVFVYAGERRAYLLPFIRFMHIQRSSAWKKYFVNLRQPTVQKLKKSQTDLQKERIFSLKSLQLFNYLYQKSFLNLTGRKKEKSIQDNKNVRQG